MIYSKINAHLAVAKAYAKLSKAKRLQVGCVLIKNDRPISVGYNGTPTGSSNICEEEFEGKLITLQEVIHAEANALMFAAKNGMSTKNCVAVLTHSPCYECSKLFIQAGIKKIYYEKSYRITGSIDFLIKNNVAVIKIGDANGDN